MKLTSVLSTMFTCISLVGCASYPPVAKNELRAEETSKDHNRGFTVVSGVAFQGITNKSHGWPVKVSGFDDALQKAQQWELNAFHVYVANDRGAGDMYPFQYVSGCETRTHPRNCIGVIMECNSVH